MTMTTRERRPIDPETPPAAPAETPGSVENAREAGDDFLRAADAALTRALSGTPEAFLSQNRQLGGQ
jgi:hypothetical protein